MTDASSVYAKAKREVADMLGYTDLDNLSAEQSTRLDIGCALRVLLDNQSGRLLRGESLDARELLMASDALAKILPPLREPPPPANCPDPRQIMWDTYLGMRQRGEIAGPEYSRDAALKRIAELEAELAALKAAGAPAPDESTPAPLPDNVVALPRATVDKQNPARAAAPAAPPKPERSGDRSPLSAAASAPVLGDLVAVVDPSPNEEWKNYVEPTGEIRSTPRGPGRYWGPV